MWWFRKSGDDRGSEQQPLTAEQEWHNAARHEAAHAVAAFRLGLPLVYTAIERRARVPDPSAEEATANAPVGVTVFAEGAAEAWLAALPDQAARAGIDAYAVQIAAGVWADASASRSASTSLWGKAKALFALSKRDYAALVELAGHLELPNGDEGEDVEATYALKAVGSAMKLLKADQVVWDRVTAALERAGRLTSAEVAALVARK